jgi:WD40 repeat protein/energy-coupling factor transporter ATP-binding protein EcfA2
MLNYSVQVGELEDSEHNSSLMGDKVTFNPFPGLRPFSLDECHLFFGREGHIDDILLKLSQNRAVTVMGYSGSGKSSLMYCGLIPMLYGGFMTQTGPYWKVVITRPGTSPIENLTNAIVDLLSSDGRFEEADKAIQKAVIGSVLRSGPNGLIEITKYIQTQLQENVFFLVDQFEELFRYKDSKIDNAENEAIEYVNLILSAINQTQVPAYMALNMRADFMGDCAPFAGLTQLVNKSNYLVPQMTRDQKRLIIEGPVAVGGGRITQRLVKRLLSDIGDNQDQLPILQHALMRTWDYWVANREPGEPMDLRHYNSIGQISQALSLHANEAYDELNSQEKEIAEVLFKSITEKSQENLGTRRPAKVKLIAELAEVPDSQVIHVVEKFRQSGRSFLMPGYQVPLHSESVVELSHESLMRIWTRLSNWVDEEFESARMYKRVSDASAMYQIGKTSLWRPPDLQLALNWQKKQNPTRTWAQRYDVAFERAIVFLDTSRITFEAELKNQEMLQRTRLRRAKVTNIILGIALLVSIGFFFYGLINSIQVQKEKLFADVARAKAEEQTKLAIEQKELADKATKIAEDKTEQLIKKEELLLKALADTRAAKNEAERQAIEAKRQEQLALLSNEKEKEANIEAQIQTVKAKESYERANGLYYLTVAQSLEAKSENIDDKELAGLTAMQGYLFHTKYGGKKYDPYVFRGLYYSLAKLSGYNYNAVKIPGGLKNKMFALVVSQNSDKFFTTGNDGKIVQGSYTNLKAENSIYENKGHSNRVLALSRDEKYLVNGSDSSYLEIFNLETPDKNPLRVKGHRGSISDIKFLKSNAGFISASTDRTLRLTNQVTGESRNVLTLPYDLKSIDISPNGEWLAGASTAGKLILVNTNDFTYKEIASEAPNRILSVAFNPAQPMVLAYGVEVVNEKKGTVKILDLNTNKVKELSGHKAGIADLEFSPDGELLASAGLDRKIQMWVVDHEEDLPIEMDNNNGNVWHIAFAKGSNYLIGSCNDGEVRVWPTDTKVLAEQVCPKLQRNMTKEEWRIYVGSDIGYESTCRSLLIKDF